MTPGKSILRKQLRKARKAIPRRQRQQAARAAARHALRLRALRCARHVALYLPQGSELSTAPLLHQLLRSGQQVYLPKLRAGAMSFRRYTPHSPLRRNRHGIEEALRTPSRSLRKMDVVIMPLVGFDRSGLRLGAGGGYYDRALAFTRIARRPLLAGFAYAQQQLPQLPHDSWDVRMDLIITERGILWPTG